jgi:GTP-binding protein
VAQSQAMALRADVLLCVVDARAGIMPDGRHHARWVHSLKRPTLLLANKSEGELDADCWELGFGPALPVSAEHGEGLWELYTALQVSCGTGSAVVRRFISFVAALLASNSRQLQEEEKDALRLPEQQQPIRVAVIGRPNVGKSTFADHLCSSILRRKYALYMFPCLAPCKLSRLFRRAKVESRGDAVEQIASWHRCMRCIFNL